MKRQRSSDTTACVPRFAPLRFALLATLLVGMQALSPSAAGV